MLAVDIGHRLNTPQPTPVEKPIRDAVREIVARTAPGPLDVHVFVASGQPGVIGWTDGDRGMAGLWLRRTWRRRLLDLGAAEVEGHLVLSPGGEAGDRARTAQAVRWEPGPDLWRAVSHPVDIELWEDEWMLRWR